LIPSIAHRTDELAALLGELELQIKPAYHTHLYGKVGVIVYRDNREQLYGPKCQKLYDASEADYVSMLDDDDWIADDYVQTVWRALRQKPDYVGYRIRYTEHGVPQIPVIHSLQYGGWVNTPEALYRDICHKNPMRRVLAQQASWEGDGGADILWADTLRNLGVVKREVFIDRELYHYRSTGAYSSSSLPPLDDPPPRPDFPWVRWI
jgi:hypothetical protein